MVKKVTRRKGAGRPSVMTDEVIRKLEEAFAFGASDGEACFYAGIGKTSLYEYQNNHPEFTERKEALKEKPVLLARQTVVKSLSLDPEMAMKYLKAKRKAEFGDRLELTGENGGPIVTKKLDDDSKEKILGLLGKKA